MLATRLFFWWTSLVGSGPEEIWVEAVVGAGPRIQAVVGAGPRVQAVMATRARLGEIVGD